MRRVLGIVGVLAVSCGGGTDGAPTDGPTDAPADGPIDAPTDAPTDARLETCAATTEQVFDTGPRWLSSAVTLGDRVYIASARLDNGGYSDGEVSSVDPVTLAHTVVRSSDTVATLAVHGDWLYGADNGPSGAIWRYRPGQPIEILAAGRASAFPMTTDGVHVYWREGPSNQGRVVRTPVAGGAVEPLLAADPYSMAVDANYLFLAGLSDPRLLRVPKAGGAPLQLARTDYGITRVAMVAGWVYFLDFGFDLFRVPVGGGAREPLARQAGLSRQMGFTWDADHVYIATDHGIDRAPVAGGPLTALSTVEAGRSPTILGDYLYWFRVNDTILFRCRY